MSKIISDSNIDAESLYTLKEREEETDDVVTLVLEQVKKNNLLFIPGQYVDVELVDGEFSGHSRSYSISSKITEPNVSITVKKIGDISTALHNMQKGQRLIVTGPSGYFYPEKETKNLVFIAGGIGIAPFYNIISNLTESEIEKKNITVFYSNKKLDDIVFFDKFNKLLENHPQLKIVYTLTQENTLYEKIKEHGRISIEMIKKYLTNINSTELNYFICGSIEFVDDFWKILKQEGVKEDNIFTEAFY